MEQVRMSLAFNWEKPPNLLYAFHQLSNPTPLSIEGRSLSTGKFLIDPHLFSGGDLLSFALFEWGVDVKHGVTHSPRILKILSSNFEFDSMCGAKPVFEDFPEPIQVPSEDSPFPGLSPLVRWSSEQDTTQVFRVRDLVEAQIFEVSAQTVVVPHPENTAASRKVRTFHFDPEMVVGTGEHPDPDPSNE